MPAEARLDPGLEEIRVIVFKNLVCVAFLLSLWVSSPSLMAGQQKDRDQSNPGSTLPTTASDHQSSKPDDRVDPDQEQTPSTENTNQDLGNSPPKKVKRGDWVFAPIPIKSPTFGAGLILGAGYIFKLKQDDMKSPPSSLAGGGAFTSNGSRGFAVVAIFAAMRSAGFKTGGCLPHRPNSGRNSSGAWDWSVLAVSGELPGGGTNSHSMSFSPRPASASGLRSRRPITSTTQLTSGSGATVTRFRSPCWRPSDGEGQPSISRFRARRLRRRGIGTIPGTETNHRPAVFAPWSYPGKNYVEPTRWCCCIVLLTGGL